MSRSGETVAWIAVDWGTSHLRAWLMGANGQVIGRRKSSNGMQHLTPEAFEPALNTLLSDVSRGRKMLVICCGMVGARQGWSEAPYANTPCAPPTATTATVVATDHWDVRILPGIKQVKPADVMRGEETQIAGFLTAEPGFEGILCLPGTHTKWAEVSVGRIVNFRTFMTGELFSLLSEKSVLRHSLNTKDWDQGEFDQSVAGTTACDADLAAKLFSLRAEDLLETLPPGAVRARLSALLIGLEITATKAHWQDRDIVILGEDNLAQAYACTLAIHGASARSVNAEEMTLVGLKAAYEDLRNASL